MITGNNSRPRVSIRHILCFLIIAVTVIISVAYYCSDSGFHITYRAFDAAEEIDLKNNKTIQEDMLFDENVTAISALSICFDTHQKTNLGQMNVALLKNDTEVQSWTINSCDIGTDSHYLFVLDEVLEISSENSYSVSIQYSYTGNNAVALKAINGKVIRTSKLLKASVSLLVLSLGIVIAFAAGASEDLFGSSAPKMQSRLQTAIAVMIMLLYSVYFEHDDGRVITGWGLTLLDCTFAGDIRHYMGYLLSQVENLINVTNYDIVDNIITALSILPVYIVQRIFNLSLEWQVFDEFRKLSLIACLTITSVVVKKIVTSIGGGTKEAGIAQALFLLSPALLFGTLTLGQIDCIAVMFGSFFLYYFINGKIPRSLLFLSFALMIKQFSIFFFLAPFVCVAIAKRKKFDYIKGALCLFGPFILSKLLSKFFFIDYDKYKNLSELIHGHIGLLFYELRADASLFLFAFVSVCCLMLFAGKNEDLDDNKLLLAGSLVISIAFVFFVPQNPQWFIYPLFFMVITIPYYDNIFKPLLSIAGFSLCGMFYTFSRHINNVDLIMLRTGIIGNRLMIEPDERYVSILAHYFPSYAPYFMYIAKSGIVAMVLLSLYWIFRNRKNKTGNMYMNDIGSSLTAKGLMIFDVLFVLLSIVVYYQIIIIK